MGIFQLINVKIIYGIMIHVSAYILPYELRKVYNVCCCISDVSLEDKPWEGNLMETAASQQKVTLKAIWSSH